MEVRYVTSQILQRYDVSLAPSQDPQQFLDDKIDAFTLACGSLRLVFNDRQR